VEIALTAATSNVRPRASTSEEIACPICGPAENKLFVVSEGHRILRCDGCGLLYVSPRHSTSAIGEFFKTEYIADEDRAERDFVSLRERSLRREADRVRRHLPDGGRLLDVGAASGAFLHNFSGDHRWAVEGVEPSAVAARYARSKFGLRVHEGFLRDLALPSASFDALTSLDTFPLHPDPNLDLREMNRLLKPGGLLFIEIPGLNFRLLKNSGLLCRLLYGVPVRLNAGVHLFYYSRATLARLAARHGFRLARSYPEQGPLYGSRAIQTANHAYFLATAILYALTQGALNLAPKEFLVFQKQP
jgi:SAM-dependent methyltransferase